MPAAIEWTEDLVERLCGEVACGRSVSEVATEEWCPSEPSIYRRMSADDEFRAKMDDARAAQQEYEADACVSMADKATPEDWQVVKLRIWARQWRAAKLAPKKYGDKINLNHAGDITLTAVAQLPTEQIECMLLEKMAALGLKPGAVESGEQEALSIVGTSA